LAVTPEELNAQATPEPQGQLEWEARVGKPVGAAAIAAAGFVVASFIVQLPLLRDKTKNEAQTLQSVHRHASNYVAGGLFQLAALFCVVAVLWYLYRATKYRREQTPIFGLVLSILGPVLFAIAGAIGPFVIRHYATEFVNGTNHTNQHAKDLVNGGSAALFSILTPIGALTFALGMIMTNVNAIRTGLLSTFVGIIGVIGGILFVLPLGPPQLLLFFWLAAVGLTLLDRWPGGRGPAWASGEAIKWPTAMERRGMAPGATRSGPRGRPARQAEANAEPEDTRVVETEGQPGAAPSRTSRKRKRKQGRKH
jgi:MFS family permease